MSGQKNSEMEIIRIIFIELGIYLPLALFILNFIDTKYKGKENKLLIKIFILGSMTYTCMEIAMALVKFNG